MSVDESKFDVRTHVSTLVETSHCGGLSCQIPKNLCLMDNLSKRHDASSNCFLGEKFTSLDETRRRASWLRFSDHLSILLRRQPTSFLSRNSCDFGRESRAWFRNGLLFFFHSVKICNNTKTLPKSHKMKCIFEIDSFPGNFSKSYFSIMILPRKFVKREN